jgi:putative transcriptional regulator
MRGYMAKKPCKVTGAILDMANDQYRSGLMDGKSYRQIIVPLLDNAALANTKPISGEQILAIRKRVDLSQAAFARYFNRTRGYVSRLERGIKRPQGAALVLLNVIRRKGFEAIL